jgi:8-oxo-dGTP pyrophosphatase MutT (NUDIX family)
MLRWAEALAGIARTGLAFTDNLYERERFDEVLHVAADIRAAVVDDAEAEAEYEEWAADVGRGARGYVTPKVAVGAVVGNDRGEILLGQRSDTGEWFYPVGWADVGYSPSEVAVKEAMEETGIDVTPLRLIAVFDALRLGFSSLSFYSLLFHCKMVGGELRGHPLETLDVGWFSPDALPEPLRRGGDWMRIAFAALEGRDEPCYFDPPRSPMWRGTPEEPGPG